jgi:hypothetical protein
MKVIHVNTKGTACQIEDKSDIPPYVYLSVGDREFTIHHQHFADNVLNAHLVVFPPPLDKYLFIGDLIFKSTQDLDLDDFKWIIDELTQHPERCRARLNQLDDVDDTEEVDLENDDVSDTDDDDKECEDVIEKIAEEEKDDVDDDDDDDVVDDDMGVDDEDVDME